MLTSVKLFGTAGANLLVFDITNQTNPQPVGNLSVTTSPAANDAQSLNIIPTSGYWTRGHRYGVLVVGGSERHPGCKLGTDRDRFPDLVTGVRKRAGAAL